MKPGRIKRILMTADAAGGIWTYALELGCALQRYGVEVHLAVMGPNPTPGQIREASAIYNLIIHRMLCRLEWMDDPWEDVAVSGKWLHSLQSELDPDIIHLNGFAHGSLAWNSPVLMAGHSCVLSWHEAVRGSIPFEKEHRYYTAVRQGLQCADAVTAPSAAMLQTLARLYGPFRSVKAVHNGRSPEFFQPLVKGPFILTAGRLWDEGKNTRALASVAHRLPWPVYAAGPISLKGSNEINLDGIMLLGELDRESLAQWMGHASIFALPARYEPFGLGILEAALAGCALVLGDVPSLRELWDGAALFVSPGDREALHTALSLLTGNQPLRNDLAGKARHRALRRSPERMAAGYYELYTRLFSGTGVFSGTARVQAP